jgi:hypothetical protein
MATAMNPFFVGDGVMDLLAQDQARQQVRKASDEREAREYAVVIAAKSARDQQSYGEFRELDQQNWERTRKEALRAQLASAQQRMRDAKATAAKADPVLALDAFRHAEDRFLEAEKDAKALTQAFAEIRGTDAAPRAITAARRAALDARETARELHAIVETARELKETAETRLEAAQDEVADAEYAVEVARRNAKSPVGEAPLSRTTMRHCASFIRQTQFADLPQSQREQILSFLREPM